MEKTKHPYLKEILKTTAKVALIVGGTYFFVAPFIAGATAVFLNMLTAGTVAEIAVDCAGAYIAVKTLAKDVSTMRERVKKQQREERVDEELEELKKLRAAQTKTTRPKQKEIGAKIKGQQELSKEKEPLTPHPKKRLKINPLFFLKKKRYDRAA